MAAEITIYCDIIANTLIRSLSNGATWKLPRFYQGSAYKLRFIPVTPTYSLTGNAYAKVSVSSMTLEISFGPAAGTESLKAYQGTFTPDVDNGWLEGTLDLNTSELNTAIGTNPSYNGTLEITLNDNGTKRTVYQEVLDVFACVKGPTGASVLPALPAVYYTKEELDSMFVKWNNDSTSSRGKTITLFNASGTGQVILYCDEDHQFRADTV